MLEIEILRSGTHRSASGEEVTFTNKTLDEVAKSYDPSQFKAPLIISHNTQGKDDRTLHSSELAFGFPDSLKRVGDRLKAVFSKISPQFVQWNRDGQILSISSSLYKPQSPSNPTPGKWALRHIAGLGASPPAIKGLKTLSLSEMEDAEGDWALDLGEFDQPDEQTVDLCGGRTAAELFQGLRDWMIDTYSLEVADRVLPSYQLGILRETDVVPVPMSYSEDTDFEDRTRLLDDREAQLVAKEAQLRRVELSNFAEALYKSGKLTAGLVKQEDLVSFMALLSEADEVNFSEGNASPLGFFKSMLERMPNLVSFEEFATADKDRPKTPTVVGFNEQDFNPDSVDRHTRAVEYCEGKGWDWRVAEKYLAALTATQEV